MSIKLRQKIQFPELWHFWVVSVQVQSHSSRSHGIHVAQDCIHISLISLCLLYFFDLYHLCSSLCRSICLAYFLDILIFLIRTKHVNSLASWLSEWMALAIQWHRSVCLMFMNKYQLKNSERFPLCYLLIRLCLASHILSYICLISVSYLSYICLIYVLYLSYICLIYVL